jgi:hypothetical protein
LGPGFSYCGTTVMVVPLADGGQRSPSGRVGHGPAGRYNRRDSESQQTSLPMN